MNFSAAQLVKQSASQILYYIITKSSRPVTEAQINGNAYATNLTKNLGYCSEKRGIVTYKDHKIYFCVDAVHEDNYIEIKQVSDQNNYQEWYLESSIMQATLYASLLNKVKTLDTPEFRLKEGYQQEVIKVHDPFKFYLYFGTDKILVEPNKKILNHYLIKACLIANCVKEKNFELCRVFDAEFKHKEFIMYKPNFTFVEKIPEYEQTI